jgi:transposase
VKAVVSDRQVERLMKELSGGETLERASMRAGMDEKTARRYVRGAERKGARSPRSYRTREDPLAAVWPDVVGMLEEAPGLEAKTIMELLLAREESGLVEGQLRTLQRRIRQWRGLHGPEREVMFPQEHRPGEAGQSDFTSMNDLGITLGGERFDHLLYHFVLPYSNWEWVMIAFSETFEALISGFQGAVRTIGRVPPLHRTDNLSAATHDLKSGERVFNERYLAAMAHYGVEPVRSTPYRAHENGDVEQAHYRFKRAVEQALLVRGSREFANRASYESFLATIVEARNRRTIGRFGDDVRGMKDLPAVGIEDFRRERVRVSRFATIHVAFNTYSISSRLIGETVEVRLYAEELEVWFADQCVARMERQRGKGGIRIDYRNVIWSLVRKPGAFARYRYREALFPSLTFRRSYDALLEHRGPRAEIEYVRILHLAASTTEQAVEQALETILGRGETPSYTAVRAMVEPPVIEVPECSPFEPDLEIYDELTLVGGDS